MTQRPVKILDELGIAFDNVIGAATGTVTPTLRLGVTGLSRAGKTIFITSLVNNLIEGGNLALFSPLAEGRLIGARLAEQPDPSVPRFTYERHLADLTAKKPKWPQSTTRISQLRLKLKYQSRTWLGGLTGPSVLNLDIVDYPGEWLLDLPLLSLSFAQWSEQALALANQPARAALAASWLDHMEKIDPLAVPDEAVAEQLSDKFKSYLMACRADEHAFSTLPPGRFLMPGELENSPALTFAPLPALTGPAPHNTQYAMMERRFEAYKSRVVRPFFRDHFARLDRQIVLVDTLAALNAGPAALGDLQSALVRILACYRTGANNPLTALIARRIDRIVFAATKADHIHHAAHNRLEAIMAHLVADAARTAKFNGAKTRSLAIAAVRATREGTVPHNGTDLE
ncbi:MAG: YcjX family protein, partial [Alphaproteobacteria bacterium]|nr:YcjX family protein [Alphaproteobacteria bacterium]